MHLLRSLSLVASPLLLLLATCASVHAASQQPTPTHLDKSGGVKPALGVSLTGSVSAGDAPEPRYDQGQITVLTKALVANDFAGYAAKLPKGMKYREYMVGLAGQASKLTTSEMENPKDTDFGKFKLLIRRALGSYLGAETIPQFGWPKQPFAPSQQAREIISLVISMFEGWNRITSISNPVKRETLVMILNGAPMMWSQITAGRPGIAGLVDEMRTALQDGSIEQLKMDLGLLRLALGGLKSARRAPSVPASSTK